MTLVAETLRQTGLYVCQVRSVAAALDPSHGPAILRERSFAELRGRFTAVDDLVYAHFAKVMTSFEPGLFVGGDAAELPVDNLDLERWFRGPKGHERRIHGHRHVGVRIVQEGPTLVLTLDAHRGHPQPFAHADLHPYRNATVPECERQAIGRRKIMRKARSPNKRPILLGELEDRYARLP